MLAQARHHFNSGNYYFATTWLGRFLNNYPASPQRKDALLLISKAYALSGREERAVPYLRDLLKEFPETAASLDPQLLKLAQSGEPARPATIGTPPPAESRPAEMPAVADTAGKTPAALSTPALPIADPPLLPAEPVSTPTDAPAQADTAEEASAQPAPATTAQPAGGTAVQPPAAAALQAPAAVTVPSSAAATVQPRSGGGEQGYYVMAGETINRRKIEPLLKKLKKAGLQPIIREESKNREVYRLVAGCRDDRNSAEKRLPLILRVSRDAFLIRDKNSFCIIAGSLTSEKAAQQEQKRMAGKGLQVEIARYTVPLTVWQVIIGYYTHAAEAEKVLEILEAQGIAATVIKPGN